RSGPMGRRSRPAPQRGQNRIPSGVSARYEGSAPMRESLPRVPARPGCAVAQWRRENSGRLPTQVYAIVETRDGGRRRGMCRHHPIPGEHCGLPVGGSAAGNLDRHACYPRRAMPDLTQFIDEWGYGAIFLIVVLGNIGLPIPEETILTASGYLAWQGNLKF